MTPESHLDAAADDDGPGAPPVMTTKELLGGGRELVIRHGAERYRLLLTAPNKLILTK